MFIGATCVKVSALSAELSEVQQSHRMDVSETAAWLKDPVEPLSLLRASPNMETQMLYTNICFVTYSYTATGNNWFYAYSAVQF